MERYPEEVLDDEDDDGTMPANVAELAEAVVGHRIVSARQGEIKRKTAYKYSTGEEYAHAWSETGLVLTLDNGTEVEMVDTEDCCAYTSLEQFFLDPSAVDHIILGVGTTDGYSTWHIYADWGDILKLEVGWSPGNPFYYGYGFDINVKEVQA